MNILYCFHGKKYAEEFYESLSSLLKIHHDARVHVVTDLINLRDDRVEYIYHVETSSSLLSYAYKLNGICTINLNQFIFLDTDTLILKPIDYLWKCTYNYPISGAREPLGNSFKELPELRMPIAWNIDPMTTELNSGVLGINKELCGFRLFDEAMNSYQELMEINTSFQKSVPDQPAITQALLKMGIYPFILDPCFNFRPYYFQVSAYPIHIFHAHASDRQYIPNSNSNSFPGIVLYLPFGLKVSSENLCLKLVIFTIKLINNLPIYLALKNKKQKKFSPL